MVCWSVKIPTFLVCNACFCFCAPGGCDLSILAWGEVQSGGSDSRQPSVTTFSIRMTGIFPLRRLAFSTWEWVSWEALPVIFCLKFSFCSWTHWLRNQLASSRGSGQCPQHSAGALQSCASSQAAFASCPLLCWAKGSSCLHVTVLELWFRIGTVVSLRLKKINPEIQSKLPTSENSAHSSYAKQFQSCRVLFLWSVLIWQVANPRVILTLLKKRYSLDFLFEDIAFLC